MAGPDFSPVSGPDFSVVDIPKQDEPTALTRAEDYGKQLLDFFKNSLDLMSGSPAGLASAQNQLESTLSGFATPGKRIDTAAGLLGYNLPATHEDFANKRIGATATDVILPTLALGLMHRMGATEAPIEAAPKIPEVLPAEAPIPQTKPILQLPPSSIRGLLTSEASSPTRFYQGPAGIADANLAYPYDLSDVSMGRDIMSPAIASDKTGELNIMPEEDRQITDIGPIQAANRTSLDVRDSAQINPAFRALVPDRYSGVTTKPLGLQGIPKDLPEVTLEQKSAKQLRDEQLAENANKEYDPNKVDVVNRQLSDFHSPEAIAKQIDSNPQTVGSRPNPDIINATPVEPTSPDDLTQIRAGQAKPTDVPTNPFTFIDSADKVLDRNGPIASKISNLIRNAQDQKLPWISQQLRSMEKFLGTNSQENQQIFNVLDGKIEPTEVAPETAIKAAGIRQILDDVHANLPKNIGPKSGEVGYLTNYITHMKEDPSFGNNTIWSYFFGKPDTEVIQPTLNKEAVGSVSSPYTETRTGQLTDYSTNLPKVLRAYISSIAKAKFDEPAVESAKSLAAQLPDTQPRLKALTDAYIRNYTSYDGEGQLTKEMRDWSSAVANTLYQSQLGFNIPFHMLHLGEIPASVFPELGARYTTIGAKRFLANPKAVMEELGQQGLLGKQIIPSGFQTPGEKFQTIMNFWNTAESVTKGIAYQGAKARALEKGMAPSQAALQAIADTKDMTYTVDPARTARAFMPEGPTSTVAIKLGGMYKQVPLKLIEQYTNIATNVKNDPAKLARMMFGASLAGAGAAAGLHTFHLNPSGVINPTIWGSFGEAVQQIGRDLAKQDIQQAIIDTLSWAIPGGQQVKKLIQ